MASRSIACSVTSLAVADCDRTWPRALTSLRSVSSFSAGTRIVTIALAGPLGADSPVSSSGIGATPGSPAETLRSVISPPALATDVRRVLSEDSTSVTLSSMDPLTMTRVSWGTASVEGSPSGPPGVTLAASSDGAAP